MSREELVKIISDLFKTNKSVEARLNLMILGDEYGNMLLEKYKNNYTKYFIRLILLEQDSHWKELKWYCLTSQIYVAMADGMVIWLYTFRNAQQILQ